MQVRKLKKITLSAILLLSSNFLIAQEICNNGIDDDGNGLIDLNDPAACSCTKVESLIPNPSFENYTSCPDNVSQLNRATSWIQASDATTDYFNCNYYLGNLSLKATDGKGYVGALYQKDWREYLGTCLTNSLIVGTPYSLQFDIATTSTYYGYEQGFLSADKEMNWGPVNVTLYGSIDCSTNFPFAGSLAPPANWIELGTASYLPAKNWEKLTLNFTPTANINAIILGPPRTLPIEYPAGVGSYFQEPYIFYDDLILNKTSSFEIQVSKKGDICSNDCILKATSTLSGGNYQWYKDGIAIIGQTTNELNLAALNLEPATYTVRCTMTGKCVTSSITIPKINLHLNYRSKSATCTVADGLFVIDQTWGGSAPYQYNFNNEGFSTETGYTGIAAGTYPIIIKDSNGCKSTSEIIVQSTISPNLNVTRNTTPSAQCGANKGTIDLLSTYGGVSPFEYSLDNSAFSTNTYFTGLDSGNHKLIVKDIYGCSPIIDMYIDYRAIDFSVYGHDAASCGSNKGMISIDSVTGGTQPYQYSFNNSTFSSQLYYDNLTAGDYYFVVKDANGCIDSNYMIISSASSFYFDTDASTILPTCSDKGQVSITGLEGGIGPYTYSFNNEPFTSNNIFYNLIPGIYPITIQDSRGPNCAYTTEVNLNYESTIVDINCTIVGTSCNGNIGEIKINNVTGGTAPYTYNFDNKGFSATTNFSGLSAGNHTIIAKDANGCLFNKNVSIAVDLQTIPIFDPLVPICKGATTPVLPTTSKNDIKGSWTPATVSNTNSNSYIFIPSSGQCATSITLTQTVNSSLVTPIFDLPTPICIGATPPVLPTTSKNNIKGSWNPTTVSNTNSNSYTFIPDPGQCATSTTLTQTVNNSLVTPIFDLLTPICNGATPPLLPTTSKNNIKGSWNPITVSSTNTDTYTFTPDADQCATSITLTQTINNSLITPTFDPLVLICKGTTPPILPTTSKNNIRGSWNPTTVSNTNTDIYTFTPDAGQCATSITLTQTINNSLITPTFDLLVPICKGTTPPILPTTSKNNIKGSWNPVIVSNTNSNSYTFTPNPGQCGASIILNQLVNPLPNANAGSDDSAKANVPYQLNATGGTGYLWLQDITKLNKVNISNPIAILNTSTLFVVKVSDENNCFKLDSVSIKVSNSLARLYIPNAFSPNGDGHNDAFRIKGTGTLLNGSYKIFNRWGQLVFESNNLLEPWDGNFKGEAQPIGTYICIVNAYDASNKEIKMKSNILLIK